MSLWIGTFYREAFELAAMLTSPSEARAKLLAEFYARPWRWVASAARGVATRLCETMAMAVFLNFVLGICCFSYWATTSADYSAGFEHYMPGFVADVFGTCAASGYAEAFNLECLSLYRD